jgi:hypothetical protein
VRSYWSWDHSLRGIRESIRPNRIKMWPIVKLRPQEQDLVTSLVRSVGKFHTEKVPIVLLESTTRPNATCGIIVSDTLSKITVVF